MFNLAANNEVDDISIVPEDFRPLYRARADGSGIHEHNTDLGAVIKAISGMQGVNTRLRKDVDEAKKGRVDLSLLKDYGETPEDIAAKVQERITELEGAAQGKSKVDLDKARADINAAADKRIQEAEGRVTGMRSSLDIYLVGAQAATAIASERGDAELLLPFVTKAMRVVQDGDAFRAVVVDGEGNTRLDPATGQEMTAHSLVKEFKADKKFGRLFEGEQATGGGSQPRGGGQPAGGGQRPQQRDQMSATQKISAGLTAQRAAR